MKGSLAYFWSDRSKIYIRTEENTTRRGSARDFNPADMSKRKTQGGPLRELGIMPQATHHNRFNIWSAKHRSDKLVLSGF